MAEDYRHLKALETVDAGIPYVPLDGTWILVKNDPTIQQTLLLRSHESNISVQRDIYQPKSEVEPMMPSPLLKIPAVAVVLSMSKSKVHELVRTGDIPSVRIDKCVRVRQSDLEAFIERRMTTPETTYGGKGNG